MPTNFSPLTFDLLVTNGHSSEQVSVWDDGQPDDCVCETSFQEAVSKRALVRLLLSFSPKLSSLLTTLKLFTPISHGSVPALVGNCGQWASGNEQWAIGHMAYCGQLPVKWVRRCLCVSRQVVEVELIHAGVEL